MPGSGKQPSEIQEQIKELLEAGFDPTTIHRRLKVGRSSIYRMKRCLQTHGTNYMPPEMNKKNGRPKVLTPAQEIEVREWLRDPKNRTRYLDDLVWLIHDRFGIVCSTTTMSKLKRKWLRVIEYEETGTPIDDLTRSQLMETHPDLPLLQESRAPAAQMSSEDQTSTPDTEVVAKVPTTKKKKKSSTSGQEQATAGTQQSPNPTQQQPQHPLPSLHIQMPQQTPTPQQQVALTPQPSSEGQQQISPGQQQFPPSQQQTTSQQFIANQPQIRMQQPQYSPLQQHFSPTQQQLNTSQQAFMQSPTMQMQMQAQMMVGAAQFSAHIDPNQLPHDFQGDFTSEMSTQHLPA